MIFIFFRRFVKSDIRYITVVFAIAVYAGLHFTQLSYYSYMLYLGIPLIGFPISYFLNRNADKQVSAYIDRVVNQAWAMIGLTTFVVTADFLYLREQTKATAGNLSVQIDKLSEAGYIEIEKGFAGKRTRTVCRITPEGLEAFEEYVKAI
jgi:hypothetical protein